MERLNHDHRGRPIWIELPQRALLMEDAANRLWECLKRLSVSQLKELQPTGPFVGMVEALVYIRMLMGEDTPTAQQIEDLIARRA